MLDGLLRDGYLTAAKALGRIGTDEAVAALAASVDRGFVSHDVMRELDGHGDDVRVRHAVVTWLTRFGSTATFEVGSVAEFAGKHRVTGAVASLVAALRSEVGGTARVRVATALTQLGRSEGIVGLMAVVEGDTAGATDVGARHAAAEELNRVAGKRLYTGRVAPGPDGTGGPEVAFEEASIQFAEWWETHRDHLRFDEQQRAWVRTDEARTTVRR
jgi:hypothetical protein